MRPKRGEDGFKTLIYNDFNQTVKFFYMAKDTGSCWRIAEKNIDRCPNFRSPQGGRALPVIKKEAQGPTTPVRIPRQNRQREK